MGKLLNNFKKAIYDEIIENISSNNSSYYAFASNPLPISGSPETLQHDDYRNVFEFDWQMIFGKKLTNNDIFPVIEDRPWTSGTIYERYNNKNESTANNNFYCISSGNIIGGPKHIYKCIDNANNSPSTVDPATIGTPTQSTTFKTVGDGYKWRYICSISDSIYKQFSSGNTAPVYPNTSISTTAKTRAGVEVVVMANTGNDYRSYHSGTLSGVANTTTLQIPNTASNEKDFYTNNSIYLYNDAGTTSELRNVIAYDIISGSKLITIDEPINTSVILAGSTKYIISPKVSITSDGDTNPKAYSVIDQASNTIVGIQIIDSGSNISWANVSITSNTSYGSGASAYAIVPPAGGHGADPATELNMVGLGISFSFANTENSTIPVGMTYNKIGLLKDPNSLNANNTPGSRYYGNTFTQFTKANTVPSHTYTVGSTVIGDLSKARGTVLYSNSSVVYISGDTNFANNENVSYANGLSVGLLKINEKAKIYTKDLKPIYIQNINNINRSATQTESFKLIIRI